MYTLTNVTDYSIVISAPGEEAVLEIDPMGALQIEADIFKKYREGIIAYVASHMITVLGETSAPPPEPPVVAAAATAPLGTFTAVTEGVIGNSIAMVFDGVLTVQAVVDAWNTANVSNQVAYDGDATVIPAVSTITLTGGIDAPPPAGDTQVYEEPSEAVNAAAVMGEIITFTALTLGVIGNSITLVFDGVLTVQEVVDAWNTDPANVDNQVEFTGEGTTVPLAETITLSGGLDAEVSGDAQRASEEAADDTSMEGEPLSTPSKESQEEVTDEESPIEEPYMAPSGTSKKKGKQKLNS